MVLIKLFFSDSCNIVKSFEFIEFELSPISLETDQLPIFLDLPIFKRSE